MTTLLELRDSICKIVEVEGVLSASPYLPEELDPPHVQVTAGDPYIEAGDVYGTDHVTHEVHVIVENFAGVGEQAKKLDVLVNNTAVKLVQNGITVNRVSQPTPVDINGSLYTTSIIEAKHDNVKLSLVTDEVETI